MVAIGIKPGIVANYTLDVTGIDNFYYAKSILLEDLKTGLMQELKDNPSYTFSADPSDDPERFHLHFGGPFGIDNRGSQPEFTIFSFNNSVVIRNISGRHVEGTVYICNMLGQKIIQQRITDQHTTLKIEAPAGCYVVSLVTGNQTYNIKILVH